MNLLYRYKVHHILFWIAYAFFWITFSMKMNHMPLGNAILSISFWIMGQGACVYLGMYWIVPRYFHPRNYWKFALAIMLDILVCTSFIAGIHFTIFTRIPHSFFSYVLMANTYAAFGAIAVKIIKDKVVADRRNNQAEKHQMQHELRFLRAQMNPHFLFNAINSIYVLIRKDPETAAQTLAKFSDMMRYQLYECNTEVIPIEKEIAYLNDYIALEKLRKGNAVQINYEVKESVKDFSIAPLLLIAFVENAFKYLSTGPENYIHILLEQQNNTFAFRIENSKDEMPAQQEAGGIGQINVKRRLELLYPHQHKLKIYDSPKKYIVLLSIQLA
ncbi:sensor histidine kinase [Chitinophaga niabensis]|uniref:Histidine kinase n=1 Tax=Chitinophaga niabensis TaxID=536979 RepID=A0A1N6JUI5_9BACT|nr:histidine kinase [Chitinophaga niabensis]SIO47970.1 Histidine kinase [Chitinophaga niabensis]